MGKKILSFSALIISDLAAVFISFILAYFIRGYILPSLVSQFKSISLHPLSNFLKHSYLVIVWIVIFAYERLYTKRFSFWDELWLLWKSTTISFVAIMVIIFISRQQVHYSRSVIVLSWLLSILVIPSLRIIIKILLIKLGIWRKRLIILGTNETARLVLKNVKRNLLMGYRIVGFLGERADEVGKKFHGENVMGSIEELEDQMKRYNSKDVIISMPDWPREKLVRLLQSCEQSSESIWIIPRIGDLLTTGIDVDKIGHVTALRIKKNLEKPWNIFIKSVFDKLVSLMLIVLCLPALIVISIAVKIDSPGPILFKQKRLGKRGRLFSLFKFRSMYLDEDRMLKEYLSNNSAAQEEWKKYKKLKNSDPRVTRVGKVIRKYSLDEIPQLINVLLGEMSLVGPRPYLSAELKGKDSFANRIARLKPGITGLWQVSGRSGLLFEERISLDDYYIRNWSLWLDIVILLRSLPVLFSGEGAY